MFLKNFTSNKRNNKKFIFYGSSVGNLLNNALFCRQLSSSSIRNRINFIIFSFLIIFLIITVRLITVASNESYIKGKKDLQLYHRLDIVDRNNNLLAINLPAASLYANPGKVIDQEEAIKKLLTVLPELDKAKILSDLKSDKKFVWIKRDITPSEHEKIYNLGMPGFNFEREEKRIYTYGNLLSHVIGYVGRDMSGLAGVEQYFNKFLIGEKEIGNKNNPHSSNNTLRLSIDVRVQNILSEEMERTMKKFSAKAAAGIIVDPNNGEILALVSKPDFDPHRPGAAKPDHLFNTVTQGVYEMGSGMKGVTVALGIDTGFTTVNDVYDLSYMKVNGFQVNDTYPMKGWHSVPHIFLKSSNIGVSQIMLEVGKKNLYEYLRKLKLLEPLDIELPERARPLFPNVSRVNDLSLTTMSYGYGLSESPAHFIQAMIPIVNGGILYPLTLLKRDSSKPLVGERVIKESTSADMRKLMRLVVTEGTGRKAEVEDYYVGGKSGTAYIANNGKYDKNKRMSSFFGIIPASKPKYIIYVVFKEPIGNKETFGFSGGGWVAAPAVGAIFKRLVALYGMQKIDKDSEEVQELNNIEYKIKDET